MARMARWVHGAAWIVLVSLSLTGCRSVGEPAPASGSMVQQASYTEDNAFSAQKLTPCKL